MDLIKKRKMEMVDHSKVHEAIAETNEGILLAEYQPEYRTDREYQSEADLENQLISDLVNHLNYERLNIHTPEELLANAKVQIEKLNKVTFSDAEWDRFVVEYLDCPNEGLVEKRIISMTLSLTMDGLRIFLSLTRRIFITIACRSSTR